VAHAFGLESIADTYRELYKFTDMSTIGLLLIYTLPVKFSNP